MYSGKISAMLRKKGIKIGHRIIIEKDKKKHAGILMPSSSGDTLVLKLDSGYNIGIGIKNARIKKGHLIEKKTEKIKQKKLKFDPNKPVIAILHTGGTIASKIDYRTGAVTPSFSPEEIVSMYPELKEIANIRSRLISNIFSENMRFGHYVNITKEIVKEMNEGCDGIIVTHGTDTLGYTSAALAFSLQDLPLPVILVGAQRSSDRGSSDAAYNLIAAANFIVNSKFSGVAVCMHESMNDENCLVMPATKTRKLHSSRRDAFRVVNDLPIAKVGYKGNITFMQEYIRRDAKRKVNLQNKFEDKVALIKIHPNMQKEQFLCYRGYKGLVIEGTGLGHAPIQSTDSITKSHKGIMDAIKSLVKNGCIVCMTTQTIFGRVNMNVYSAGRDLQSAGVIPLGDMLPETAFVKLAWVLGNGKKEVKSKMLSNLVGEITERSDLREKVGFE